MDEASTDQGLEEHEYSDDELTKLRDFIDYLDQNKLALAIRGTSTEFLTTINAEGENPVGHGSDHGGGNYSYWSVMSPRFSPALLTAGTRDELSAIRTDIARAIKSSSTYYQPPHSPLVLYTFIPVDELTQNEVQAENIPDDPSKASEEDDMRYMVWQPGISSLNYGKGQRNFPGWRTSQPIPPERLRAHTLQGQGYEHFRAMERRIVKDILSTPQHNRRLS